jgi:hypothetical protein
VWERSGRTILHFIGFGAGVRLLALNHELLEVVETAELVEVEELLEVELLHE